MLCYCCSVVSCVWLFPSPWTAACQSSLSLTISRSLLKLTSPESMMLWGVSSSFVPITSALNLSQHQGLFQWVSSSNEYSELISLRINWFDLLVAQGALRSILQHHSSKALIFRHSAFFIVQLSQPHMTGKTIALTRWTFVGKVMSLFF